MQPITASKYVLNHYIRVFGNRESHVDVNEKQQETVLGVVRYHPEDCTLTLPVLFKECQKNQDFVYELLKQAGEEQLSRAHCKVVHYRKDPTDPDIVHTQWAHTFSDKYASNPTEKVNFVNQFVLPFLRKFF